MTTRPRKQRARSLPIDPDRYPACTRCHLSYTTAAHWPEGPICHYCYKAAGRREGICADCGHTGIVPGLNTHGHPTCIRCSGIPLDRTCTRCGVEAELARRGTCWRCALTDLVHELLTGPDGRIAPALEATAKPRSTDGRRGLWRRYLILFGWVEV